MEREKFIKFSEKSGQYSEQMTTVWKNMIKAQLIKKNHLDPNPTLKSEEEYLTEYQEALKQWLNLSPEAFAKKKTKEKSAKK